MGLIFHVFALMVACACAAGSAGAATPSSSQASQAVFSNSSSSSTSVEDVTKPKPLDGVVLEAVETYINPKPNEINLGVGIYPFDAYYYGLSINAGYTYHFNRNIALEIPHVQYFFSFQKELTTELADRYSVNPQTIPTLDYIVSGDLMFTHAYGKFVLLENYIRYFRSSAFLGLGDVKLSSDKSFVGSIAGTFGLKFEVFTRDNFSWDFEARDALAFNGLNNYLTFILGTGLSF